MTIEKMLEERASIWDEYTRNREVYEYGEVPKTICVGHGEFIPTGKMVKKVVSIHKMTMTEWDETKAKRYEFLQQNLAEYERQKRREEKIEELERARAEVAFLEKWLEEN